MNAKNRILYIDFAKAIAIVLVVIGHYWPDDHPIWYGEMREVIYGFHMPLFMFASGFVYTATVRKEPYAAFIARKVKRLMVPYFVVSVIIITIKLLTGGSAYVENPVTAMSYVRIFYLPEAGYFTWFIWALWWIFVIVPFFNDKRKRVVLLICAIVLHYFPVSFPNEFCLSLFKEFLLYFCLGCSIRDYKSRLCRLKGIPIYVYFIIFVVVNYLKHVSAFTYLGGAKIIVPLIGIAFMISLCQWIEKYQFNLTKRSLMLIASSSYIIYLLHTTFEGFAKAVIHKIPVLIDAQNDWYFSLEALIVISCGVIAPILLDIYVLRRYKVTKVLFGYK